MKKGKQTIPKIIHQIWIGKRKPPYQWIDTFKVDLIKRYPEYKYYLWTEKNIKHLKLINKKHYLYEKTPHGRADILRYEILYQYGGIYIDADSKWFNKDLTPLIEKTNNNGIFIGKERTSCQECLANGVIGCSKNNPIMYYLIIVLDKVMPVCAGGHPHKTTGPYFCDQLLKNFDITVFPSEYFYPVYWLDWDAAKTQKPENFKNSYMGQYGYTTNKLDRKIL